MTDPLTYALFSLRRAAEHGYPWGVLPHDATAIVEEMERLRGEVERERAAVVAWLRNGAGQTDVTRHDSYGHAFAHEIERGEHRREEET